MYIVSASRDSEVGGEGIDEESDQEGNYDSCMESNDECALPSSDEDVGTPFSIEWCTCGHAHSRSCPLNPRNKGALSLPVPCILPQLNPLLLWVHVAQRKSTVVTHHVGSSLKLSTVQLPEPPVNAM